MNKSLNPFRQRCRGLGPALWLVLLLLLPGVIHAQAEETPPALPHYLYGVINASSGDVMVAFVSSQEIAHTTVFVADGQNVYRMALPADDPNTPAREGARENEVIAFAVNGYPLLEKVIWHSGHVDRIDLHRAKLPIGYLPLLVQASP